MGTLRVEEGDDPLARYRAYKNKKISRSTLVMITAAITFVITFIIVLVVVSVIS